MTEPRAAGDPLDEQQLAGFMTDAAPEVSTEDAAPPREDVLEDEPPTGAAVAAPVGEPASPPVVPDRLSYLDTRPGATPPREYHFPRFERSRLSNGLTVVSAHLPGRPLLLAQLIVRGDSGGGAASEAAELGGITVITARALTEGTSWRDAIELIEASERLGAELSADSGWDSFAAAVEVPRSHLAQSLVLLSEVCLQPSFPNAEIIRLRDERLNDLKQAKADPRRRIERVFPETIFAHDSPYVRPLGGVEESVTRIDRSAVVARHSSLMRPEAATFIVCGDLENVPVKDLAERAFGTWPASVEPATAENLAVRPRLDAPRVLVVDRPGSAQSELRVGHIGVSRRIPDFHAVSVMNTILGGLFNSRLNRLLREDRGYTYGAHSTFDMRRGAGPFAVRCAVQSEVTVPAIRDILGELDRIRDTQVSDQELALARDYLVGVFPLRFETAAQVASAIGGLIVFDLPDDELDHYRPAVAAVSSDEVLAAAQAHIRPQDASIVVVGDARVFEDQLRGADLGEVLVVREAGTPEGA